MNATPFRRLLALLLLAASLSSASALECGSLHVLRRTDNDAFGTLIDRTGSTDNSFLYCGERWDANLGFYYLRARFMNPGTGRFWTMDNFEGDPESPGSLHKYLYSQASPAMFSDPSGMGADFTVLGQLAVTVLSTTLRVLKNAAIYTIVGTSLGATAGGLFFGATGGSIFQGMMVGAMAGGSLALAYYWGGKERFVQAIVNGILSGAATAIGLALANFSLGTTESWGSYFRAFVSAFASGAANTALGVESRWGGVAVATLISVLGDLIEGVTTANGVDYKNVLKNALIAALLAILIKPTAEGALTVDGIKSGAINEKVLVPKAQETIKEFVEKNLDFIYGIVSSQWANVTAGLSRR